MFRTTDTILIAVMLAAAGLTFKVKHDSELKLDEVRALEAEIRVEENTIDVLKADWSLVTQPDRLQRLVEAYNGELLLEPVEAEQIGALDSLDDTLRIVGELAAKRAKNTDATQTGAVSR